MNPDRLSQLFNRHCRLWHFWLRDLRSGEVVELGTRQQYPIGSCFKLAVLMAFFDQLEDPAMLDEAVTIPPERFRIGSGIINVLDSAVSLTWRQMLHLMLAASDGTCTDWLISRVGLPAVNAALLRHAPESHLAMDLGDMVAAFRNIPGALDCKTREFSNRELSAFIEATNALGATHAEDLAALVLGAWRYGGNGIARGGGGGLSALPASGAISASQNEDVHRAGATAVHEDRLGRADVLYAGLRRDDRAEPPSRDRPIRLLLGGVAPAEQHGGDRRGADWDRDRPDAGTEPDAERGLHAAGRGLTGTGNRRGSWQADYQRCLAVKRFIPRCETFITPALRVFAKTGSLGGRFIMDDCGVLVDPVTGGEISHFAYCSVGWHLPGLMAETAGGVIAVEIARMLGLDPVLNADYTPEGEALLMGAIL